MTRIEILKALLSIADDEADSVALLEIYLQNAEQKVLNRLYPFGSDNKSVPQKYEYKVLEIAQYLFLRRGSEGETGHSENGVNRSYENADIPKSMLAEITPMVEAVLSVENVGKE